MLPRWKKPFISCCLSAVLIAVEPAWAVEKNPGNEVNQKHVRVLTIGNSFTRNANQFLGDLVEAAGHRLSHESLIVGGSSLELHASKARAAEKDRDDPEGHYGKGRSLQHFLQAESWDYVTIQQVSLQSHDLDTYRPHASRLADVIRRYAPQARLLVHQTWAYRRDDPRFTGKSSKPNEPLTQSAMYRGLADAYRTIAGELGARRIPVGDAFYMADSDPKFGYRGDASFDFDAAEHPALPDQTHSLHVGWRWQKRDGRQTLRMDGHHAGVAGQYLGACVWLEALFGESAVGNSFVPAALDSSYARFLQLTAHRAVAAAQDAPRTIHKPATASFNDPQPQSYEFQARASTLDRRTRQYPNIKFVFEVDGKPQDVQHASVDTLSLIHI